MSRLARITIAIIVGLQVIFWITVVLWMNVNHKSLKTPSRKRRLRGWEAA